MFIILFMLVNLSLLLLRLRRPDIRRSFKLPLASMLSVIAIIFLLAISYYLVSHLEQGLSVFLVTVFWIIFGSLVYFAYSEKELDRREEELIRTVYTEKPVEKRDYVILVPVANPVVAKKLVKFAEIIARQKNGSVIVMNTIKAPVQTPPSALKEEVRDAKKLVEELISGLSVTAGGIVKVGHDVAEAIISTAVDLKANLIIMGWRGGTFRKDVVLGSTVDPVLLRAPCDVVVVRMQYGEIPDFRKILVPVTSGPHAELACEIAGDIARERNVKVRLIHVAKTEKAKEKIEKEFERLLKSLRVLRLRLSFL